MKKTLSFILCIAMLITICIPAIAEEDYIAIDSIIEEVEEETEIELFEAESTGALPDAVNGVITLTEDVELGATYVIAEGETLTIDLNGKTITGTMHKSAGPVIENKGTLTLKNGTVKSTAENGGSALTNSGTAVIEGATLNGAPNANGSWPSYTVNNIGTLTINKCYITSYHGAVASYAEGAVATLNNTDINMTGIPGFTNHAIYTYSGGKAVVNGGNIVNNATDQGSTGGSVINGSVEVNAGTIKGRIENYYGTPVIKGGTFSENPKRFAVADAVIDENADGTYTVKSKKAFIGEEGYYTLKEAFYAAEKGDTIEVRGFVNEGSIKLPAELEDITVIGAEGAVIKDMTINANDANSVVYDGLAFKNLTFDNTTFVFTGQRSGEVLYKDLVFDNNEFINIVRANGYAAFHTNLDNEDNENIVNFTFTNNLIDGVTGASNSGVLLKGIKGTTLFENNVIKNVKHNAIQISVVKKDSVVVLNNNILQSNGSSVVNIGNAYKAIIGENEVISKPGYWGIWFEPEAKIGDVLYRSFSMALEEAAAVANEENPVTVELEGKTFEWETVVLPNLNNVTIKGAEGKKSIIKDTVIKNADKATDNITGITFDGIVFDNSRIYVNGWTKGMNFADWTITNCEFKNLESTTSIGGVVQFNLSSDMIISEWTHQPCADVALDGFTFTNNVINGAHCNKVCSGINSAAMEGTIVIENNVFNDIEFNAIQLQNVPEGSDVSIKGNTFTNIGRQILHLNNNLANIEVNNNVFVKTNEANLYISHISTRIEASDNYYGIGESLADAKFDADYESKFNKKSSVKAPIVLAHYEDVALTNRVVVAGTQIGDEYFDTFEDAVEAAEDGSVIEAFEDVYDVNLKIEKDITIDLNGKTFFFGSKADEVELLSADANSIVIDNGSNVTIDNGTIDFTGAKAGYNVLIGDGTLTLGAGVNVVGDGFSGNAFALTTGNSVLTLDGTKVNLANHAYEDGVYLVKGEPDSGIPTVKIINAEITVNNGQGFMVNVNADIDNSEIKLNNMKQHVLRNVGGTVTDTVLDVKGSESGIKNTGAQALAIDGTSVVTLTGATASDIILNADSTLAIADTAKVEADDVVAEDGAVTGNLESNADKVYVQFRKTDIDANGDDTKEGFDVYEIVLAGSNEEKIHELASADLTFEFIGTPIANGDIDYFVAAANGVSLTNPVGTDRYMFNYNGVDKYEESGKAIVIGTITVEGYGSYTLGVKDLSAEAKDTNAVYATEIRDNIVEGYEDAATLVINTELKADDGMEGKVTSTIAVPVRDLTVVVDFPNEVVNKEIAYQAMKVTVTGGDLKKAIEIDLGSDAVETALDIFGKVDAKYAVTFADGAYTVALTDTLTVNNSYTVTVTGEGYRTARYTVTMTDNKEINFWNNVKDNETAIEENVDGSKTTKNFLAGDIVKDNNINIYDLSAVVSYFAKVNNGADYAEYVKYDLNRDGVIDSKDVAYVLVSWNE